MRILVGGIVHESNTFSNVFTGQRQFDAGGTAHGDDILTRFAGTATSVGGFLAAAPSEGIEPIFTVVAGANPSGPVVRATYEGFKSRILEGLGAGVDGVYLALHGAMTVAGIGDGEGNLLAAFRAAVGPRVPIVATLDLPSHLTEAMLDSANLLILFKTYPHVDMAERAVEAAHLLARLVRREIRPTHGHRRLPLLPPATRMRTAIEPMLSVGRRMVELERGGEALTASFNHTFCYADVPYVGAGALVYTDDDPARARALADELAEFVWERRAMLWHEPTPIPEAVDRALRHDGRPVVISDGADNPGGGSAADGVEILRELLRRDAAPAAVGTIWDPGVVDLCFNAGEGAELDLRLGGKVDRHHGDPIDVRAAIERLTDGRFTYQGPIGRGSPGDLGRTAVLRLDGVRVVVNENRVQNYDPEILRCVGIEPTDQKIVVVKSVVHFRAAYEPIASLVIEADGPGIVGMALRNLSFRNVPRPIFGLDRF